jgi:hypothetical protein
MKSIVTSLMFAVGLLAAATVTFTPASSAKADRKLQAQCCDDPAPVCPPFCEAPAPKAPAGPPDDRRR